MKISEVIKVLEEGLEKHGDEELELNYSHGNPSDGIDIDKLSDGTIQLVMNFGSGT